MPPADGTPNQSLTGQLYVASSTMDFVLDFIISYSILANLYHVILEHSPCVL